MAWPLAIAWARVANIPGTFGVKRPSDQVDRDCLGFFDFAVWSQIMELHLHIVSPDGDALRIDDLLERRVHDVFGALV